MVRHSRLSRQHHMVTECTASRHSYLRNQDGMFPNSAIVRNLHQVINFCPFFYQGGPHRGSINT